MRSVLFVPGDRPDRFAKALASGADAICLDLEDSVLPDAKAAARSEVLAFLSADRERTSPTVIVRANPVADSDGQADLKALGSLPHIPLLMLPKVEDAHTIADADAFLGSAERPGFIALIESAQGLRRAADIGAAPNVVALALGPVDLAVQLGAVFDDTAMSNLRVMLRLAAAEADVATLDGPATEIHDPDVVGRSAQAAAALGFDGKLAIHPRQIEAIHSAFTPRPEQIAEAKHIVASARDRAGAFQLEGRMIDAPVIAAAQRLLLRAGSSFRD